jgi:hypothetical protein
MKHFTPHKAAWMTLAGTILAIFSLSSYGQNFVNSGDNGGGVMPMSPLSNDSVPLYGERNNVVPGPPAQPKAASRPASWVGGTAPATTPSNGIISQVPQNPQSAQYADQGQYSQQGQYPQTGIYPPNDPNQQPPLYDQSNPQTLPPGMPANPPTGQLSWGTPGQPNVGTQPPPATPPDDKQLIQATVILARVGSEGIYAYEVATPVDQYFAQLLEQIKDKASPQELEMNREAMMAQRDSYIKQSLKSAIESKLIYQDAKRQIPAEGMAIIEKKLALEFDKSELPKLLKREEVSTTKELDQKLKLKSSSLSLERKKFNDKTLVQQWLHQQIKRDEEITYDQMIRYYNAHLKDFTTQAKVRWEELTVTKANYPSTEEAFNAIAEMGNQILAGAPFAEIAKQRSDGFTAQKGGVRDWASKGSLTDTEINAALFGTDDQPGLPAGQMSQIIETRREYTILRVIERVDQKTTEFLIAQSEIKKKILDERTQKQVRDYLAGLERRTPIWTIYDGNGGNLKLAERLNDKQQR